MGTSVGQTLHQYFLTEQPIDTDLGADNLKVSEDGATVRNNMVTRFRSHDAQLKPDESASCDTTSDDTILRKKTKKKKKKNSSGLKKAYSTPSRNNLISRSLSQKKEMVTGSVPIPRAISAFSSSLSSFNKTVTIPTSTSQPQCASSSTNSRVFHASYSLIPHELPEPQSFQKYLPKYPKSLYCQDPPKSNQYKFHNECVYPQSNLSPGSLILHLQFNVIYDRCTMDFDLNACHGKEARVRHSLLLLL